MKRWSQHPPSAGRVALVLGVVAVCVLIVAVERMGYWPAWLTADRPVRALRPGGF